jgi:hypothetical protein
MEYLSKFPTEYIGNSSNTSQPSNFDLATFSTIQQGYTTQEKQNTQFSWSPSSTLMTSSPHPSYSLSQSPSFTTPFTPLALQSGFGTTQSSGDFRGGNDFDFEMMITSDAGMDEQWTSFMRDTGLLDGSLIGSGLYGAGEIMSSV